MGTAASRASAQFSSYRVTAGGLLWRREGGELEVCLLVSSADRRRVVIPRGRVQEDERLEEAALRAVKDLTGYHGRTGRRLAHAASEDGEIACLFLFRHVDSPRFESAARKINAAWIPLKRAMEMVATSTEVAVLRRAAEHLAEPVDPTLPFEDATSEMPVKSTASGSGR